LKRSRIFLEEDWLDDNSLEPDAGGPPGIEQPQEIPTKTLSRTGEPLSLEGDS
jgi:hypothetical protein